MSDTSLLYEITEEDHRFIETVAEKYRGGQGVLITALHEIQEQIGFIPRKAQVRLAETLNIPLSEVYSVITFYAFFTLQPKGKYQIVVCNGTACYVKGAKELLEKLQQELGIKVGETTGDRLFSIEAVRCIGACGLGPVLSINGEMYARVKPEKIPSILADVAAKGEKAE